MSGSSGVYHTLVPFPTNPKEPKNWWAGQSPATSFSGLRCRPSLAGNTPPRVLRTQCAISQTNKLIQYLIPPPKTEGGYVLDCVIVSLQSSEITFN